MPVLARGEETLGPSSPLHLGSGVGLRKLEEKEFSRLGSKRLILAVILADQCGGT